MADLQYWSFGICAIRTEVHSIYLIDAHSLQYREGHRWIIVSHHTKIVTRYNRVSLILAHVIPRVSI